ncbi:MAG: hypothetical protein H7330_01100 [Hymenobacteraceae bacterium]|nr:hypothetical protein [Hymenobacteraceae bacterium]
MTLSNLWAYLRERFPPVNMALFAVIFLTVRAVARTVPGADTAPWGVAEWGGVGATIAFFFHLRVFDEHKDFALDALNHPQRVLQTGRITLGQLRGLARLIRASYICSSLRCFAVSAICISRASRTSYCHVE